MVPLGFRGREEIEEKDETREEREEEGEEETVMSEKNPPRSVSREARYSYINLCITSNITLNTTLHSTVPP